MLSVIVPAHNERENLVKLIPLLQDLNSSNEHEILVALSSKNKDNSGEFLNANGVTFVKCQKKGRACQMNEAAAIAKGEVFVFLHADVIPPKTFFLDIETTIAKGFDAGFFSYQFDSDSFLLKINASFTTKDGIFTGGGDQCLFIKKVLFNALGQFDEEQVLMEDFEFFQRMKKHKIPYKIVHSDLIVSARKYQTNSYLRVNLSNLLLVVLFKLGCPSCKLKSLHNRLLNTSY